MLEAIEHDPNDGDAAQTWRAGYDAIGRRLWTESDRGRREFYWDGDRLAAELDLGGRLRIFLYAGQDALVPLAFVDYASRGADPDDGHLYQVTSDGAGAPLHIENDRGEIVWWASRVDPWGKIEVHKSAAIEYNLRWPGHYLDQETGLHYNRYRYYDPTLGRYLTPDPIGYRGSEVNLYAYCANPLVQVDLLGLHPDKPDATDVRGTSGDVDPVDAGPQTVPAFRVEGPGNKRVHIDAAGNVRIAGDGMFFVNFGDEGRARVFLERRNSQFGEGNQILSVEVNEPFRDKLRTTAVTERDLNKMAKTDRSAKLLPLQVDKAHGDQLVSGVEARPASMTSRRTSCQAAGSSTDLRHEPNNANTVRGGATKAAGIRPPSPRGFIRANSDRRTCERHQSCDSC